MDKTQCGAGCAGRCAVEGGACGAAAAESGKEGCRVTTYQVFQGIRLAYIDAHVRSYMPEEAPAGNILEISHCREGRMECHYNNEFCYAAPGDLVIARMGDKSGAVYFPLKNYSGISVMIDIDRAPRCLSCFLQDVTVSPRALEKKFCGDKSVFIARAQASFEHIFSELYSVPEEIKKGYIKIKVLELMLFLSAMDTEESGQTMPIYSLAQVSLGKAVGEYLAENIEKHVTLRELTERFHMSGTHIKNSFKAVYGVSLYAYGRALKMQSAAYMLEHSDSSVMEIAGKHGYDNSSKFAKAFADVMGVSPSEYRRRERKQPCPNGAEFYPFRADKEQIIL